MSLHAPSSFVNWPNRNSGIWDVRGRAGVAGARSVAVLLLPGLRGVEEHAQLPRVLDPGTAGMGHARQLDSREDQEGHNVRNGFV